MRSTSSEFFFVCFVYWFGLDLDAGEGFTSAMNDKKNWHQTHSEEMTFAQRLADSVASGMGSWRFIIVQTVFVVIWMALNVVSFVYHWDVYPYILLNLLFSTQAAYAAPIIMMAQNRQNQRDRAQADEDFKTNIEAKLEIEQLQTLLSKIELEKLDKIITMLEKMEVK
jgi:uncharacterized membrane protein